MGTLLRPALARWLAFANLVDVEFNLVQRTVEEQDLDTVALLCRGADFQRALALNPQFHPTFADDARAQLAKLSA